jgi:hypothetical protein
MLGLGAKPPKQLPLRRLRLCPSQFSSLKDPYCPPRAGFCGTTKKQTPPDIILTHFMRNRSRKKVTFTSGYFDLYLLKESYTSPAIRIRVKTLS